MSAIGAPGWEDRFTPGCGDPWPCLCPTSDLRQTRADMPTTNRPDPVQLNRYEVDDLLGHHVRAVVRGYILALHSEAYPGSVAGPTRAEIRLTTGGTITLPLTALTLVDPT